MPGEATSRRDSESDSDPTVTEHRHRVVRSGLHVKQATAFLRVSATFPDHGAPSVPIEVFRASPHDVLQIEPTVCAAKV